MEDEVLTTSGVQLDNTAERKREKVNLQSVYISFTVHDFLVFGHNTACCDCFRPPEQRIRGQALVNNREELDKIHDLRLAELRKCVVDTVSEKLQSAVHILFNYLVARVCLVKYLVHTVRALRYRLRSGQPRLVVVRGYP
jgi:hypothetical protein